LRVFATGSLPAGQFNSSQLPFLDFGDVPEADIQARIAVVNDSAFAGIEYAC
jgi:hypothetical protein